MRGAFEATTPKYCCKDPPGAISSILIRLKPSNGPAAEATGQIENIILPPYTILYSVAQGMEIYMIRAENGPFLALIANRARNEF